MIDRVRRRYTVNFPRHLADCEFNYYRLLRLMPGTDEFDRQGRQGGVKSLPEWCYILDSGDRQETGLVIQVEEIAKYTTTVHITAISQLQNPTALFKYFNGGRSKSLRKVKPLLLNTRNPINRLGNKKSYFSLDVRLYHDASLAEVIGSQGYRRVLPRYDYPNTEMHLPDEQFQHNHFLGELLENCLLHGRIAKELVFVPIS